MLVKDGRESGITLLEISVYTGIALLVGSQIFETVKVSTRAVAEADTVNRVSERNRTTLFRLAAEIRGAIGESLVVSETGRELTMTLASGFAAGEVVEGDDVRYEFSLTSGESDNGSDDNGNGLIDEGRLVRKNLSRAEEVVICEGLDLDACAFVVSGGEVTVTVANVGHLHAANAAHEVSRFITVDPRN